MTSEQKNKKVYPEDNPAFIRSKQGQNLWIDKSFVWFMVFNAYFNYISDILWWSVLFVEETVVLGENHRPVTSHWQTLSDNVVSSTPRHEGGSNSQL